MAKKVKALSNFIGSSKETEEYGGHVPDYLQSVEGKMSDSDKRSFKHFVTAGTVLTVSDKRASELLAHNLVEVVGEAEDSEDLEKEQGESVQAKEKVIVNDKPEKAKNAGPNGKK